MKTLYYADGEDELFRKDREKAIKILRSAGFNEEVLKEEIEYSKKDFGEEFFWKIANCPGKLNGWPKENDLSDKDNAHSFVLYCMDMG